MRNYSWEKNNVNLTHNKEAIKRMLDIIWGSIERRNKKQEEKLKKAAENVELPEELFEI